MKLQRKEITFRHWFNRKFGDVSLDETARAKYVLPTNVAEFDKLFKRDFPTYPVSFNSVKKYANSLEAEVRERGSFELPQMLEDIDLELIEVFDNGIKPRIEREEIEPPQPFEYNTFEMNDMEDIPPKLHQTGELIDRIDSTYTDEGGQYGGTVTIITGESGSGKTTLEIDKLTKYKRKTPSIRALYLSTEMTRGDLRFYMMTLPAIGEIETLLLMDYVLKNQTKQAIDYAFDFGYDIIVLDSYQDLVGKLADSTGMRPSEAQRYVIEKMIGCAENKGTAVRAIQHLTKGGTYVGSTLLKHTTTAMFELKIDQAGRRYGFYSKNRRGGEMQYKPLYFDIDKEKQCVVYDEEKFNQVLNAEKLAKDEKDKKAQSMTDFMDIIEKQREANKEGKGSDDAQEIHLPHNDGIAHPENESPLEFRNDEEEVSEEGTVKIVRDDNPEADANVSNASKAFSDIAEDVNFEDVDTNYI